MSDLGVPSPPPRPSPVPQRTDRGAPGRTRREAAQPGRRRLARPAPQPDLLVARVLVVLVVVMAAVPQLFTSADPRDCALDPPACRAERPAFFGYDIQGCDVYARTVYGARASVMVGVFATLVAGAARAGRRAARGLLRRLGRRRPVPGHRHRARHPVPARRASCWPSGWLRTASDPGIWAVVLVLGLLGWPHGRPGHPVLGDHRQGAGLRRRGPHARRRATRASCCGTSCPTRWRPWSWC